MKILLPLLLFLSFTDRGYAQAIENKFFALHSVISGDSTFDTAAKQVIYLHSLGYEGLEISGIARFETMKKAMIAHGLPPAYFYVKVSLAAPHFEPGLEECIKQLKGTKTLIAPYIPYTERKEHTPKNDSVVISLVQHLADISSESGLEIAIYPHYGFYIARVEEALNLVKQINRSDVGLSFNLCHWLATTTSQERPYLKGLLREIEPYLKMVIINGANDVVSSKSVIWDDYILPLGEGDYDTFGLVNFLVTDLDYKGQIGVQCYNIKMNKAELARKSMEAWIGYKRRMSR